MALKHLHLTSSSAIAAAAASATLFAAACGGTRPFGASIARELTCIADDLGGGYVMQTAGEFSTRNLSDLAEDASKRKSELESAGLLGGRFNYWKQAVGRPPFPTPLEATCQVMQFVTEAQAARFVRDLQAEPGDLATMAIAWVPADDRTLAALSLPGDLVLPPGTRAFRLAAASPEAKVALFALVAPHGRFVQSVYMGNGNGTATPEDASTVLANLTARTVAAVAR